MAGRSSHQPDFSKHLVTQGPEFIAALGHAFAQPDLLERALTHSSCSGRNYERLEFLGDRVLGLVVAEWLCELYPQASEGDMAKLLSALVGRESLAVAARTINLGDEIKMSEAEAGTGGRSNASTLADCCEAVIGALYLDGGLVPARRFIRAQWQDLMDSPPAGGDAKTILQEWSQAKGLGLPEYKLIERSGPDHAPQFTIEVSVKDRPAASASGTSKRIAEREAAALLLKKLGAA